MALNLIVTWHGGLVLEGGHLRPLYQPTLAVEFGRKVISATQRPSFAEMEGHFKQQKPR